MFQKYALTVHTCIIKLLFIVSTNVINTGRLSSDHSKYLIHITCLKIVQVQWMPSIIFLKMKDFQPYTYTSTCRFLSLFLCRAYRMFWDVRQKQGRNHICGRTWFHTQSPGPKPNQSTGRRHNEESGQKR